MAQMTKEKKEGGLAGIIAADSSICLCSTGTENPKELLYRGYTIQDLAKHAQFEEVAYLLIHGDLPNDEQFSRASQQLLSLRALSDSFRATLEHIPPTPNLMDAMRSQVSLLGHIEPEEIETPAIQIAYRLTACLSSMLLYWYHFHASGTKISVNTGQKTLAGHILELIRGDKPKEEFIAALNTSLILYAEHEFNASTFTVRTIASTLADFYSAICGGIGALSGPLHGAANEKSWFLISQFSDPGSAEKGVVEKLAKKEVVMGFGHRVYTHGDPRSDIAKEMAQRLSKQSKDGDLFFIAERIEKTVMNEKGLFPNVDFWTALVYHYLGIPVHFFTPLFAMARITGWSAHLMEQRAHNRLIRPLSNYIGPKERPWSPLAKRKK
jgi:2-methylcitrate synthase